MPVGRIPQSKDSESTPQENLNPTETVEYNPKIVWVGFCSWMCTGCGELWDRVTPTVGHNCKETVCVK